MMTINLVIIIDIKVVVTDNIVVQGPQNK